MSRWSEDFEKTVSGIRSADPNQSMLDIFFVNPSYQPQNDQERQEFEEFSLISSAMALMIHVAKADKIVQPEERQRIMDEMAFQLHQRHYEYNKLSEEFGVVERTIISNVFDRLIQDYENGTLDVDETVRIVNMIFQNNPYSRNFLIRLCYYSALSDRNLGEKEAELIDGLATQLHIDKSDQIRIANEVRYEMRKV